jgi:uncharacterized protein YndB with AHSA1/START domain
VSDGTTGSRVLVSMRVRATPERAFDAFTAEIGRWWKPNVLFPFTDRTDGVLAFESEPERCLVETAPGGHRFVVGQVRNWDPPRRLVVSWRESTFGPDVETELHVRFEDVGEGQTRVVVEHFGWDAIPVGHVARHGFPLDVLQLRFAEWWRRMLDDLVSSDHRAR